MKTYSFYDILTGALHAARFVTTSDAAVALNTPDGHAPVDGAPDPARQRVDLSSGQVVPRDPCPVTASIAGRVITLTGVPTGAAYNISGDAQVGGAADASGILNLTFGAPGNYQVTIDCFPAIDYSGSFALP